MSVEQQREEFIQKAMKSGQLWFDKCDKCGSERHGYYCLLDRTFKCIVCAAKEKYPDPPKLDYEDFIRI